MNEHDRREIEELKTKHVELSIGVQSLGRKIGALEQRLRSPVQPKVEALPIKPPPVLVPAAPVVAETIQKRDQSPIPLIKPNIPATEIPPPESRPKPSVLPPTPVPIPVESKTSPAKKEDTSFEMRLGTYWLVRVGIVMLLTGVAFFGAYAYQNFIPRLGAGGKITLLYAVSAALLGAGCWIQRGQERMRNYAQVLIAGGLAAVYFTTYAAHHITVLQVIQSPVADGVLLFGWAAFTVWMADRKKSEVMALFAVLLAYHSSAITHAGLFTLYSNLVLTLAAVFFLVRNRWSTVSFASLIATYASYSFWRFYHATDGQWHWATTADDLWTGNYFLMSYWLVFTAALFLSKHEQFAGGRRATFLSLNNGGFFCCFLLTMLEVHRGGFWQFCLIYGGILLALMLIARRVFSNDRLCANAYLTQGLLLVTLGFLSHFTGLRLSLVLAVESVMLLALGEQQKSRVMRAGSIVTSAIATMSGLTAITSGQEMGLLIGSALGALMLLNAFLLANEEPLRNSAFRLRAGCYSLLAISLWLATTWQYAPQQWLGLVLGIESALFLWCARPLRNQVLAPAAIGTALLAAGTEVLLVSWHSLRNEAATNEWLHQAALLGLVLVGNALALRRTSAKSDEQRSVTSVTLYVCLGLTVWLTATIAFTPLRFLAPLLAVDALILVAAYKPLRLVQMPFCAQAFLLAAQLIGAFSVCSGSAALPWWNPVAVILATLAMSQWWQKQKLPGIRKGFIYGAQAVFSLGVAGLLFSWLQPQFQASTWLGVCAMLALAMTLYAVVTRSWFMAAAGQIFAAVSCAQFVIQMLHGRPQPLTPLAPAAGLLILSLGTAAWLTRNAKTIEGKLTEALFNISIAYRAIAVLMTLSWIAKYVAEPFQCCVLLFCGAALFGLSASIKRREPLIYSGIFSAIGVLLCIHPYEGTSTVKTLNLIALLLLPLQQHLAKKLRERIHVAPQIHAGVIVVSVLTLWLYISRSVLQSADGFYLTASWSAFALAIFVFGMIGKERVYRWLGLGILGCSICRVMIYDMRQFEIIYRVLSFMALGVVLLVLGFLYNRFQERLKEWL